MINSGVLIWNYQNGWITLTHLAERGGLDQNWNFQIKHAWNFVIAEFGLLNPLFFIGMIAAAFRFWKRSPNALALYLFSMGAPLFLFYLLYTFRSQVQPNWIAPAIVPLFCLTAMHWDERLRHGFLRVRLLLAAGAILGLIVILVLHDTDLVRQITRRSLPAQIDPLRRVRGWNDAAETIRAARAQLLAEGKPVFLIGDHYGITSLISFYMPEARAGVPNQPLAFYESTPRPVNQFYFWPGYKNRFGQNAIYVQRANRPKPPPKHIEAEFETVTDLGFREVRRNGQVLHRFRLFACRNLKSTTN